MNYFSYNKNDLHAQRNTDYVEPKNGYFDPEHVINNNSNCDQFMIQSNNNFNVKNAHMSNNSFYNQSQNFDELGFDKNHIEMNSIPPPLQEQDSRLSLCNQLEMFESYNNQNNGEEVRNDFYNNQNSEVNIADSVNIELELSKDKNQSQNLQVNYPNTNKTNDIRDNENDWLSLNTYSKSISNYNRNTLTNAPVAKTINRYQEEEQSEDNEYGYSFNNTQEEESIMQESEQKNTSAGNGLKVPTKFNIESSFTKNPIENSIQIDQPQYDHFEESYQDSERKMSGSPNRQLSSMKKANNNEDYCHDDQMNLFEEFQSQKDFMQENTNNESVEVLKLSEDYDLNLINKSNGIYSQQGLFNIQSPNLSNHNMGYNNKKTVRTRYECEDD